MGEKMTTNIGVIELVIILIACGLGVVIVGVVAFMISARMRSKPAGQGASPCPNCGKDVAAGMQFCPHCGTRLFPPA